MYNLYYRTSQFSFESLSLGRQTGRVLSNINSLMIVSPGIVAGGRHHKTNMGNMANSLTSWISYVLFACINFTHHAVADKGGVMSSPNGPLLHAYEPVPPPSCRLPDYRCIHRPLLSRHAVFTSLITSYQHDAPWELTQHDVTVTPKGQPSRWSQGTLIRWRFIYTSAISRAPSRTNLPEPCLEGVWCLAVNVLRGGQ